MWEMKNGIALWVFSGLILSIYITTISPSIAGGDSGELVAEGCNLGTAHPPGYPLFTLLVHALKIGGEMMGFVTPGVEGMPDVNNVAYKVNVLSCCFTTGAAYLVGRTVQLMMPVATVSGTIEESNSQPQHMLLGGSLLAMGLFAFSPLIWQYAVTAEVFPMNTFFAALIVYLVLLFSSMRKFSIALFGAFICGLALCNQHTIVLYEAPLILWMLFLLRHRVLEKGGIMCLVQLGLSFLSGLLPYAYLPLSALYLPQNKGMSWGYVATLHGFLHHFLRRDYGTFQLFSGEKGKNAEGFAVRTAAYVRDIYRLEGLYVTPALVLIACVCIVGALFMGVKKDKRSSAGAAAVLVATSKTKNSKKKQSGKVNTSLSTNTSEGPNGNSPSGSSDSGSGDGDTSGSESDCSVSAADSAYTPLAVLFAQAFYFLVFHNLANLPMGDRLLYGVHQRFWMQPNVVTFMLAGTGWNYVVSRAFAGGKQGHDKEKDKSSRPSALFLAAATLVPVLLVILQLHTHWPMSNQADAWYFRNYATAILAPLPENSVLIINYDMQWTSVRYLTQCERFRPDITVLNLSMMTYVWFYTKRHLYPHLRWPGTYCSAPNSAAVTRGDMYGRKAFTLEQFISANAERFPIFLGGKVSHPDPLLDEKFEFLPVGLVSRIIPRAMAPPAVEYAQTTQLALQAVLSPLSKLPDLNKYPETTWEWTIGRDFKDRVVEVAASNLEAAIRDEASSYEPLIDAVYLIESAVILEGLVSNETLSHRQDGDFHLDHGRGRVPTPVLKNAGLAHMHLVRHPQLQSVPVLRQPTHDHFSTSRFIGWPSLPPNVLEDYQSSDDRDEEYSETSLKAKYGYDWKAWSAGRFMHHWGLFLQREDAQRDSQYQTIAQIYTQVDKSRKKASGQTASSPGEGGGAPGKPKKKSKRRRT